LKEGTVIKMSSHSEGGVEFNAPTPAPVWKLVACSVCLLPLILPERLIAESNFKPRASVGYASNSNVFLLADSASDPVGKKGPSRSDTVMTYIGGLDADLLFGRQRLYATGQVSRAQFSQFDELSHNEYLLDGGLQWKLGRVVDGKVDYRQERRMLSFANLDQTTRPDQAPLILETEKDYGGAFNVDVMPSLRIETSAKRRDVDSARPPTVANPVGVFGLGLRENIVVEGLKYIGVAKLSTGFEAQQINGHLSNVYDANVATPVQVDYKQSALNLVATYKRSDRFTYNLEAGSTRREQSDTGTVSAFTYLLGVTHALTPKTSIRLQVNRGVENDLSTYQDSQLSTGQRVGLTWSPTQRTSLLFDQEWRAAEFSGQLVAGSARKDNYRSFSVELRYRPIPWLAFHPYFRNEVRRSNSVFYEYDADLIGIDLEVRAQ
jgi:hypothetical protein